MQSTRTIRSGTGPTTSEPSGGKNRDDRQAEPDKIPGAPRFGLVAFFSATPNPPTADRVAVPVVVKNRRGLLQSRTSQKRRKTEIACAGTKQLQIKKSPPIPELQISRNRRPRRPPESLPRPTTSSLRFSPSFTACLPPVNLGSWPGRVRRAKYDKYRLCIRSPFPA